MARVLWVIVLVGCLGCAAKRSVLVSPEEAARLHDRDWNIVTEDASREREAQ